MFASAPWQLTSRAGSTAILSLQDQGTLQISGGSLSITDTANPSTTANLTQSGGQLGGTGTLTASGAVNWTGGTQTDAGKTVLASGATLAINGASDVFLRGGARSRSTPARPRPGAAPRIQIGDGATIENAGTFNANADQYIHNPFGGSALIHNTGTFRKASGTGATHISVPFDNDGTVEAAAGTLSLEGGDAGSTTGSFNGSATDSLVRFGTGTYALTSGASLSGRTELSGATLQRDRQRAGHSGGTSLTQSGGTLGGTGTLTASGAVNWTGGTQTDAGKTVLASGATLSIGGASDVFLRGGRTLQIDSGATATWSGATNIQIGEGATIENAGTFNANADQYIYNNLGGSALIHNTGTFRKASGTGETHIHRALRQRRHGRGGGGHAEPRGGRRGLDHGELQRLRQRQPRSLQHGNLRARKRREPQRSDRTLRRKPCNVTGERAGHGRTLFTQSGGTLGGTGTLTASGAFNWTGGTQTDAGKTVLASGATLSISGASTSSRGGRTLQIDSGATATMERRHQHPDRGGRDNRERRHLQRERR